jgi:transcription elongation GreA/GreB family factor
MTADGARRLRAELDALRHANADAARITEVERILASLTAVEPPEEASDSIAFGAEVTVENREGETQTYRIVGVDEVTFAPNAVSWISPTGKTLLAAELGDRVTLPGSDSGPLRIVKIAYPRQ